MSDQRRQWTAAPSRLAISSVLLLWTTILVVSLAGQTDALPRFFMGRYGHQTRRDFAFDQMLKLQGIKWDEEAGPPELCGDDPKKALKIDYYKQKLDHFSNDTNSKVANNGYWQQHYQMNSKFFKNVTNEPVIFLMIGGESYIQTKWVCYENYTYMMAAKQHNALVIQLEHRFFGKNKDLKDMSVESLQYLTTSQALADIKEFILWMNGQNKWTNPKWVAFGGSYPGTMAALLRQQYPGITQGNIASSAPLYATVDFWQYAYVMESTIKSTSQACYDAVKTAFETMVSKTFDEQGRQILNTKFHIKEPGLSARNPPKEDIYTVTSTIFGAFQEIIQYTYDGARDNLQDKPGDKQVTIRHACEIMTDDTVGDDLDKLYQVFVLAGSIDFVANYTESIAPLQKTDLIDQDSASEGRGWMWLSCNEYGWLQSTSNNGLFGDVVPLSLYIKMCSDLFNHTLNATQIEDRISVTLDRIGRPKNFNATNVYLPNGAFDPWSSLGVLPGDDETETARNNRHMVTHLTPGAAHCSDMYGYYPGEPAGLNQTRQIFWDQLDYYLKQPSVFKTENGATSIGLSLALAFVSVYVGLFN